MLSRMKNEGESRNQQLDIKDQNQEGEYRGEEPQHGREENRDRRPGEEVVHLP